MREERVALLEREGTLPLKIQAELLGLSRASLYYEPQGPTPREIRIKHRIDEIYTERPFYGYRRIAERLHREGVAIDRKTVAKYMREMGLKGIAPGPNLSRRNLQHRIYPYLLRGVTAMEPNHIWGIDVTYIRLRGSWMYLVAVLDWYSRYIVSWELSETLEMEFVLAAVDRALLIARPRIWNSDQGSHFTSPLYLDRLKEHKIEISMDGKGRALDNVFTERLWRTIKYEDVYLKEYVTPRETRMGLRAYIDFYNTERPHQSLAYQTPAAVYFQELPRLRRGEVASDAITDRISADL